MLALALSGALAAHAVAAGPFAALGAQTLPNAGNMRPMGSNGPKDFAFIKEGDYFHLFWIRHDWNQPSDSTERDFGHSISRDLFTWTELDPVIPVRPD